MKKETNIIKTIGIIFLIISISIVFLHKYPKDWKFSSLINEFYANISSELFSISITILLIDYLYERKSKINSKQRLLRELGSEDRGFTSRALKELKETGALEDGSLVGLDLKGANLSNLDFSNANLKNVNFENAILEGCTFSNCDLTNTNFISTNLKGAIIENANFENTVLSKANLYSARLSKSKINNCDFLNANLQVSELIEVEINNCKLEGVNLTQANLTRSKIKNSKLLRSIFTSCNALNLTYERCNLKDVVGIDKLINFETAEFLACENFPVNNNN